MKKVIVSLTAVILLLALGVGLFLYNFTQTAPAAEGEAFIYEVVPGSSFREVAAELETRGAISSAFLFRLYARLTGEAERLKVGEYAFSPQMRPAEVIAVLTSGKSVNRIFTVAEGLNIYDIATLYEADGFGPREEFLSVAKNSALTQELLGEPYESFEGYLFPETYGLTKFTTAEDLVKKMVGKFKEVYAEVAAGREPEDMDPHQVVILASIVEKETGAPEERPLISSVFHNRMDKGMRLQTDPTVLYGIWDKTGTSRMNITKQDLQTPTRYNTYTQKGLPFGPIANPGRDALMAAVRPAESDYLFFVSRNDGTHVFSEDYNQHKSAVQRFQLDPKAREGKSWRDLNK